MKNTKKRSLIQYTWQLKRALVTAFAALFAESSMYECAEICCDQKNKTLTNLGKFMNFNWKLFRLPSPQIPTKTHEISHKPHGHNYMGQPNIWSVIHSHLCTVVKILWQKCVVNLSLGFLLTANQPSSCISKYLWNPVTAVHCRSRKLSEAALNLNLTPSYVELGQTLGEQAGQGIPRILAGFWLRSLLLMRRIS